MVFVNMSQLAWIMKHATVKVRTSDFSFIHPNG